MAVTLKRAAAYASVTISFMFTLMMFFVEPKANSAILSIVMRAAHLISASLIVANVIVSLILAPYADTLDAIISASQNEKCVPLTGGALLPITGGGFGSGSETTVSSTTTASAIINDVLESLAAIRMLSMVVCFFTGFYFAYRDWYKFSDFAMFHALFDLKMVAAALLFFLLEACWGRSERLAVIRKHRRAVLWACLGLSFFAYFIATTLRAFKETVTARL